MASMAPDANPEQDSDDAALRAYGVALADAVDAVIEAWVVRSVERLVLAWQGGEPVDPLVLAAAADAGRAARAQVGADLRALLALDIDEQRVNPLAVLRGAVRYPTGVLQAVGVPGVVRDEFDERAFPDDEYGLTPASFGDLDPSLHDPGLEWGAAKAHVHLRRRRAEGRR
jgi:hypothetical protein